MAFKNILLSQFGILWNLMLLLYIDWFFPSETPGGVFNSFTCVYIAKSPKNQSVAGLSIDKSFSLRCIRARVFARFVSSVVVGFSFISLRSCENPPPPIPGCPYPCSCTITACVCTVYIWSTDIEIHRSTSVANSPGVQSPASQKIQKRETTIE